MTEVTIKLGRELFRFDSYTHWCNKAQSWFADADVQPWEYICIDAAGRVVAMGKHFMRAQETKSYPVTVYLIETDDERDQ